MELSQKDVESLAISRISQQEKGTTNKWFIGLFIGLIIGFILWIKVSILSGGIVMVLSVIAFLYYNSQLTKKQNVYKSQLIKQWQDEKNNQVGK